MTAIRTDFGLYAVLTHPVRGYEYLTKLLRDYEVSFVQLRHKDGEDFAVLKIAETMRRITEDTSTALIINDMPHIARDCDADGIHVGQDDESPRTVRRIVGDSMVCGLSTHTPAQVEEAAHLPVDYIGYGPVWATQTKENPDPLCGPEALGNVRDRASVPLVAIGGITAQRLPELFAAGIRNYALSGPLCRSSDPEKKLRQLLSLYKRSC
ncbi:MAG: thiamine phosphate synthase [Fibrobacterota bacterium]